MHTALAWVPRGVSAPHPKRYELNEDELERVSKLAKIRLEDAQLDLEAAEAEEAGAGGDDEGEWEDEDSDASDVDDADAMEGVEQAPADPNDLSAYKLDDYDSERTREAPLGAFGNIRGLQFHRDAADDPYITMKDSKEDDEEERAELEVYPTDSLIVTAKTEDDLSQLDIYVYDDAQENLYVHHDLLLPAMPLCLEWLDFAPPAAGEATEPAKAKGSYIAVGTLDPEIEIWSLDVLDGMYPDVILGKPPGETTEAPAEEAPAIPKPGKKKTKKAKKAKPVAGAEYHVDSVLALSWNRVHRSLLASASADCTVKLWDLSRTLHSPALRSFDVHSDKVQALEWNQREPTVLLSGSWDKSVRVFDSRAPAGALGLQTDCDIECVRWNSWEPHEFFISLENGLVQSYDSRTLSSAASPTPAKALFTLSAHDKAVSALDYSTLVNGLLVTGGTDDIVKLWNVGSSGGDRSISLLASRDLGVGKVFAAHFCPDEPATIAVAGSKGAMQVWDTTTNPGVRKAFGEKIRALGRDVDRQRSGIVSLAKDDEDDESDAADA